MAHVSDPEFAVLRVLRVKGVCETEVVARGAGMTADDHTDAEHHRRLQSSRDMRAPRPT